MATNPLPILLLGGAALFLMFRNDEDVEGTEGSIDRTEGPLDAPCQRMKGIYEFRKAPNEIPDSLTKQPSLKRLPLTLNAFEMLRKSMVSGLSADYNNQGGVLIGSLNEISKMSPNGAALEEMTCDWVGGRTARMEEVYKAAETLMYQIQCWNMFGVWTAATPGNLPVTKEFYDSTKARFVSLKASNPKPSRAEAILSALEDGFDTGACEWRGSASANFSDRQRAVMTATGTIFDQVFGA